MAPSLDVNDTDEDESNNSTVNEPFDEPSSENLIMDVSEPECNIVNENSSQSDSSDVPTNVILELNYDDHIEPSANVKEASYFNIFECGRNLLDHLDVTYQRAFTSSETSPAVPTASENRQNHQSQEIIYISTTRKILGYAGENSYRKGCWTGKRQNS